MILVNIIMIIGFDCNENCDDNDSDCSANYDEDDKDSELKIEIVVNFCFVFGSQLLLAWHFNENYKQSGLLIILCQFTINPPFPVSQLGKFLMEMMMMMTTTIQAHV